MPNARNPWYVYLLRCSDGSIYTGISKDVDTRVKKHNAGAGAVYTAQRRPVSLIYQERHRNQSSAMVRERQIKRLRKAQKEVLALGSPRLHSQ
ncbi:MAG: GIY-YIG nuclease family protein [candidate division Zixibacteria bacterium]|nr:GIY-YIG nuclease family protein [candidate division Zixibacteria bacterium]